MSKEKKVNYIEPKVFKESMLRYYETDKMTNEVAGNLKKIAEGLSYSPNFRDYSYRDEMVGDALIKMYAALKNKKFKFENNTNPFSYFTTIAFHAFINRIKKEKKNHETLKNYRELVYSDKMTDSSNGSGFVYVKPSTNEIDDFDD